MVWSNHDFAREVRRQLVELESIRKRAPADAELHERIDRLEESHHYILRKLGDCSRCSAPMEKKARQTRAVRESTCEGAVGRAGRHARLVTPQVLHESPPPIPSRELRDPAVLKRRVKSLLALQVGLPHPAERCASCGRVLLLSLIAGGQIVFHKAAWHHKSCVDGNKGLN